MTVYLSVYKTLLCVCFFFIPSSAETLCFLESSIQGNTLRLESTKTRQYPAIRQDISLAATDSNNNVMGCVQERGDKMIPDETRKEKGLVLTGDKHVRLIVLYLIQQGSNIDEKSSSGYCLQNYLLTIKNNDGSG